MTITALIRRRGRRWALNGAAAIALAYILTPLTFVTWLAFFRQEIPSFPPEGYSLKWFAAILDQRKFVDGFAMSFQVGILATVIGLARAARQPAADAVDRAGRGAGHGDVRLPCRGRERPRCRCARHLLCAGQR